MHQNSAGVEIAASSGAALPAETPSRIARRVRDLLLLADIRVGGDRPWDIRVNDPRLYRRLIVGGLTGLGDAYVDQWWDCEAIDQFFDRAVRADLANHIPFDFRAAASYVMQTLWNFQRPQRSRANAEAHYNLGNDLFQTMLDPRMIYTCGYWKNAGTRDQAQEAKLELVCRKIGLRPGQRILDIGCGWGGFAKYAAQQHGANVVAINVSSEQVKWATDLCRGLPVEVRLQDYREINEPFDHIVSIGCLEHVGPKNHRRFMQTVRRCLRDGGLCLLHFIASRSDFPNTIDREMIWIQKHIFPGAVMPSLKQLGAAIDRLFVIEDLHNFGSNYDPTLMAWFANFQRGWPALENKYGPRFYRMWKYYLMICAGAFRARKYQLWQVVLSKDGVPGGYEAIR
jgi:cyclopropane-fatty-acyl-phospholipid synthase